MLIRRATFEDKERILEISSTVWDGDDYIPNIIDEWLQDEDGEFSVIVEDGIVMGVGKLSLTEPGVGWLEGLRVHPDVRSRGYAKKMNEYYIEKGRQMGFKFLRLSTYYQNYASIHVIESYGFKKIANFFFVEHKVDSSKSVSKGVVIHANPDFADQEKLIEFFLNSFDDENISQEFLGYGWLFKTLSRDEVLKAIERGHIYYIKEDEQIDGAIMVYPDHRKDNAYYIVISTGSDKAIRTLLNWTHQDAIDKDFEFLAAMIPDPSRVKSIYLDLGYKPWEDRIEPNVFIYELKLGGEGVS
ncbi:MAG: GNAT family N-acetyltransferase [Halanaerobiales bacterium]|nr:GNAT family N-acetyltransferase [Halanaerobiales bacterium]